MYYIHKDYLGSFQSITDENGELVEKLSFDPWGRRRNADDWSFSNVTEDYLFDRGYTGHEHLDDFGLINMNGRVYDPFVARFLSPDPFVQNISSTQSFDRYSYVSNNPLKFVDPSGYQHGNHPMTAPITVNYAAYNILGSGYQGGLGPQNGNHWSNEFNSFGEVGDFFFMSPDGYDQIYGEGANDIGNHLISHESSKEQWGQGLISISDVRNVGGFEVFEPYESNWDGSESGGVNLSGGELTFISLNYFDQAGGGDISNGLTAGSFTLGATGYHIGNHMKGVSRFGPLYWNDGRIFRPALSGYRYGPLSGQFATKLGAGLRMGGNVLGGIGIAYTGYQMYQGNISGVKGSFDIGFGVVGFLGPVGLGVSAIYFIGDTFIPGGWQATPQHMYDQIQRNSSNGVWWGAHNHFK